MKSHPFYSITFVEDLSFRKHDLTDLYESLIDHEDFNSSLFAYDNDDVEEQDENNENVPSVEKNCKSSVSNMVIRVV